MLQNRLTDHGLFFRERCGSCVRSGRSRRIYAAYFTDMVDARGLFFPEQEFSQSFPAQLCFVPTADPAETGKVLLAEKAKFRYLSHFLYTDFYRGLMAGNAPRRCHNCGRYFADRRVQHLLLQSCRAG
ncbi:hypothetical protein N510_001317 [Firmicutes bacterium ASF500]|nr:hypothetical protein N510_001317 [Firmicutes bacterium ASF500]